MASEGVLLEVSDFEVQLKDGKDGKKFFDRVSRYKCHSTLSEMDLEIDINTDLYPLVIGDRFKLALASTLDPKGKADEGLYSAEFQRMKSPLMDRYDYIMHGRIYKVRDVKGPAGQARTEVYVSYGGLLMLLTGDAKVLDRLDLDNRVYLLIKKLTA